MPLMNRVDPFGRLVAVPQRGLLMGNRGGRLHDPATRTLGPRGFVSRRWISCALSFRDRRREVWGHGYTELFFCDEAAALACGHRPCFACRHAEARGFAAAFARGNALSATPCADAIDRMLHAERMTPLTDRPRVDPRMLPTGTMVDLAGAAFLVTRAGLRAFSFAGYGPLVEPPPAGRLLTPPSIVRALAAGYAPLLHPSAAPG